MSKTIKIYLAVFFLAVSFVCAKFSFAASVGDESRFFVDSFYDAKNRTELDAVLKVFGVRAYFYVDKDFFADLEKEGKQSDFLRDLSVLSEKFDNNIYPKLTSFFDDVWNPGIDNDSKITILVMPIIKEAGGYMNIADEFFKERVSGGISNEREMIYMNSDFVGSENEDYFLAHELQHLITFNQKTIKSGVIEDVWLNEARSEFAADYLGNNIPFFGSVLERRLKTFLKNYSDPLGEWKNQNSDYASVALFSKYLKGRFGAEFFQEMSKSKNMGIESINDALAFSGYKGDFSDVFSDWALANYLNSAEYGKKYSYSDQNIIFKITPSFAINTKMSETISFLTDLKDWSLNYFLFQPPAGAGKEKLNLNIKFYLPKESDVKVSVVSEKYGGAKEISVFDMNDFKEILISGFGSEVKSVLIIPINTAKKSDFSEDDPKISFRADASVIVGATVNLSTKTGAPEYLSQTVAARNTPPVYPDGSLLRAKGDYKVYIVKGSYKRHILSSRIFDFYHHFGFQKVIEVSQKEIDFYKESFLVRADGDEKIYEINGDLTKHWLNMSSESFSFSGRSWDSVFIVNKAEKDFYLSGADVVL